MKYVDNKSFGGYDQQFKKSLTRQSSLASNNSRKDVFEKAWKQKILLKSGHEADCEKTSEDEKEVMKQEMRKSRRNSKNIEKIKMDSLTIKDENIGWNKNRSLEDNFENAELWKQRNASRTKIEDTKNRYKSVDVISNNDFEIRTSGVIKSGRASPNEKSSKQQFNSKAKTFIPSKTFDHSNMEKEISSDEKVEKRKRNKSEDNTPSDNNSTQNNPITTSPKIVFQKPIFYPNMVPIMQVPPQTHFQTQFVHRPHIVQHSPAAFMPTFVQTAPTQQFQHLPQMTPVPQIPTVYPTPQTHHQFAHHHSHQPLTLTHSVPNMQQFAKTAVYSHPHLSHVRAPVPVQLVPVTSQKLERSASMPVTENSPNSSKIEPKIQNIQPAVPTAPSVVPVLNRFPIYQQYPQSIYPMQPVYSKSFKKH